MSQAMTESDHRGAARVKLPPMYTLVRVRPAGARRYRWSGYIYDISATGMRFELDAPVEPGTRLEIRAMLPGAQHVTVRAAGTVVRVHDDDNLPGPTRMGMTFDTFATAIDRDALATYLSVSGAGAMRRAA